MVVELWFADPYIFAKSCEGTRQIVFIFLLQDRRKNILLNYILLFKICSVVSFHNRCFIIITATKSKFLYEFLG
jgi:hypothetical protein